ncbi:MAG: hypothetical protein K2X77_10875 [Candidatus Obscuribacterales bacterium]|nr:hypothetical protein [Candidatus Obscuribacterales bacterium]
MAKKTQIRKSAVRFKTDVDALLHFTTTATQGVSDEYQSWIYDGAIIRLYRLFEKLMLEALVGAINNDTTTVSATLGVKFPKHLTDEACQYLVIGSGYFDFKGRDGLLQILKEFVPSGKVKTETKEKRKSKKTKTAKLATPATPAAPIKHYLVTIIEKAIYKPYLDQLSALRNFAAHESTKSRNAVLKATNQARIKSSGAWLKRTPAGKKQRRFDELCDRLKTIASEIETNAPAIKTRKPAAKAGVRSSTAVSVTKK